MKKFKIIEHTADVGIEAYGRNLNELFANAAYGMFSIITNLDKIGEKKIVKIEISQSTLEDLIHSWLDELLFRESVDEILFRKFDVQISLNNFKQKFKLVGKAFGEKFDSKKHHLKTEIKAVTYHQLKIEKIPKRKAGSIYKTRVIFDV